MTEKLRFKTKTSKRSKTKTCFIKQPSGLNTISRSVISDLGPVSDADGAGGGRLPGEHPLLGQPGLRLVKVLARQGVAGRPNG